MRKYFICSIFLSLSLLATPCLAIEGIVAPDTRASFVVPGIRGEVVFQDFNGTCTYYPDDIGATVYNIDLDVQTLEAGFKTGLVKSSAFLDADKHKYLSFDSSYNVVTGKYSLKMHGDLTLKGISLPIVWDVQIDPASTAEEARFKATVDIDRRRWGMNSFSGFISNTIKITVLGVMVPREGVYANIPETSAEHRGRSKEGASEPLSGLTQM